MIQPEINYRSGFGFLVSCSRHLRNLRNLWMNKDWSADYTDYAEEAVEADLDGESYDRNSWKGSVLFSDELNALGVLQYFAAL